MAWLVWTFWEFGLVSGGDGMDEKTLMMGLEDVPFPFEVVPRVSDMLVFEGAGGVCQNVTL